MKTCLEESCRYEFSFPQWDTVASVENRADEVVIRMSRDTLSEERKAAFVRELAGEGFIADRYQWLHSASASGSGRVRWLVDPAWWLPGPEPQARTDRFMVRVLATAVLLWLAMMALLLYQSVR